MVADKVTAAASTFAAATSTYCAGLFGSDALPLSGTLYCCCHCIHGSLNIVNLHAWYKGTAKFYKAHTLGVVYFTNLAAEHIHKYRFSALKSYCTTCLRADHVLQWLYSK